MAKTSISEIVGHLAKVVIDLSNDDITDRNSFDTWISEDTSQENVKQTLNYRRRDGMPDVTEIIEAHFHPHLPLVMLSYTEAASRVLGYFNGGWSPALKHCRGIIFDRKGQLVALPIPKFFNHGEPQAGSIPESSFIATEMYDGHQGIIFHFSGSWRIATREGFDGPIQKLADKMLRRRLRSRRWQDIENEICPLVEIIHPETGDHIDYGWEDFVLIGATDRKNLRDHRFRFVDKLARRLRSPLARTWPGNDVSELRRLIDRSDVRTREGYVARFASGKRLKFKFRGYVSAVAERHLSYADLMEKMMADSLENLSSTLPEEIHEIAAGMIEELIATKNIRDDKGQRDYLNALPPIGQNDAEYKRLSKKFIDWMKKQQ